MYGTVYVCADITYHVYVNILCRTIYSVYTDNTLYRVYPYIPPYTCVHCPLYTPEGTVYNVHFTVYTVYYTVCTSIQWCIFSLHSS